ncbi:helix-turn-helix domain-containing protein [Guyparkeria halopsychrophila]|uniref:Crp/Fnr family transcriptional regulator n=1 Tax=Guyparkeria halopsychrophila TaxID=3139421 RepID=UPI0037C84DB9
MISTSPFYEQNLLLATLPDSAKARIFPHLKLVEMHLGDSIHESDQSIEFLYFPTNCIISLLYVMLDGSSAEISVVGNEGMEGISVLMGGDSTPNRTVVQSEGFAYRLPSSVLKAEFDNDADVRLLMLRFAQVLITQMSQTAVCNRHHSIDKQLCRWLLLSLDRLQGNQLNMTQELIAKMLGVRREGVTEAASKLQNLGIIEYHRGRITVLDRPRLEEHSCECYAVVKRETDRLISSHYRY